MTGKVADGREVVIERPPRPCYQQSVRALAVVSLILPGACLSPGGPPGGGGECFVDQECLTGEVCARDGLCWPQDEVRLVKTTWTLRGLPADETTCARNPDLYIEFDGDVRDELGFSPVPCEAGQFTVDKLPHPFTRVEVGVKNGPWSASTIRSSGMVQLDLTF